MASRLAARRAARVAAPAARRAGAASWTWRRRVDLNVRRAAAAYAIRSTTSSARRPKHGGSALIGIRIFGFDSWAALGGASCREIQGDSGRDCRDWRRKQHCGCPERDGARAAWIQPLRHHVDPTYRTRCNRPTTGHVAITTSYCFDKTSWAIKSPHCRASSSSCSRS